MTFAQIQADAEAHLAAIRAAENIGPEHVEKTTQLVCVLASELAALELPQAFASAAPPKPKRTRKAS